jgi:hypothetical protein
VTWKAWLRRSVQWLRERIFRGPAIVLVASAFWAVFAHEQLVLITRWTAQESAARQEKDAELQRDADQARLVAALIDRLTCTDDEVLKRRQRLVRDVIALGAPKYSALVANQLDFCAKTPEQKKEVRDYRDQSNDVDVAENFFRVLRDARSRYELGLRDVVSLGLFDQAFSLLPKAYGDKVDQGALNDATSARDAKDFDKAAADYMRAFRWFGLSTSGTNSPVPLQPKR